MLMENHAYYIACSHKILFGADHLDLFLFQCSYVIDIDVHVPWAPDIEVRLPLIVKPSPDKQVGNIAVEFA